MLCLTLIVSCLVAALSASAQPVEAVTPTETTAPEGAWLSRGLPDHIVEGVSEAVPVELSNAQRLARGLKLAAPQHLYSGEKRALAPRASTLFSYHTYTDTGICITRLRCSGTVCDEQPYTTQEAAEAYCQDTPDGYDFVRLDDTKEFVCIVPGSAVSVSCDAFDEDWVLYTRD